MPIRKTPKSEQVEINIVGSNTYGRYPKVSLETTFNMFVSDNWLLNTPGFKKVLTLSTGGQSRGIFRSVRGGFAIAVVGSSVYKISPDLSPQLIGTISSTHGDVYIDENLSYQICIADGINAYVYNYIMPSALVRQTGLQDNFTPSYVCFHGGFFLFGNSNPSTPGTWYAYSGGSGTTLDYNSTMRLQTKPDTALAVQRIPGQGNHVLVMGATVCELWVGQVTIDPLTGVPQAYQIIPTINIDFGCASVSTIASSDQYIAWLGVNENNSPVIMAYTGNGAESISTDGISYVMEQIRYPAQSTAFFYRQDGHSFYQLTFYNPADNLTLLYDFTTKKFFTLTDWDMSYHPATKAVYFNDLQYFTSLDDASLYQFSTNFTTYDDNLADPGDEDYDPSINNEIPRLRICKNVRTKDARRFIANSITLMMEQGDDPNLVGLSYDTVDYIVSEGDKALMLDEDGVNLMVKEGSETTYTPGYLNIGAPPVYQPKVDLCLSYDGGMSFGNWVSRPLHPQGWRKNVITWEKMGAANDLVCKFQFLGTYRFVVNNAIMEIY